MVFRFRVLKGTDMAFLRSDSNHDSPTPSSRIGLADFYLLLLRAVFTVPLLYYQVQDQARLAWGFLWEQKAWPLVDSIAEMGLPQPSVTAATLIFVLLACPFGILIGFLTRINAGLSLLALLFFFLSGLPFSEWLTAQTYVLFLGVALTLVLSGPGKFSFDGLFAAIRRRKKELRAKAAL